MHQMDKLYTDGLSSFVSSPSKHELAGRRGRGSARIMRTANAARWDSGRLRLERLERGISLNGMACLAGVSSSGYRAFESARQPIGKQAYQRLRLCLFILDKSGNEPDLDECRRVSATIKDPYLATR